METTTAEAWALIPILIVAMLGVVVGGAYAYRYLRIFRAYLARHKTLRLHLALNRAEIEYEVLLQKIRIGVTSERARALLNWIEHEEPLLKGEDAGLILPAQEALLQELMAE